MSTPPTLPHKTGPAKFVAGFGFAFSGLWHAIRTQVNMKVHISLAIIAIVLGILLHISAVEFAIIFVAIAGVLVAEMFNTVMEICVDLASPDYHPLAKIAKDVAAGAVLLSAIMAIIIALFIFGPHLWALIFR
ncbi:MAG: diacylglycerol kinase family protein [Ktedonobacteraceae bacterium]